MISSGLKNASDEQIRKAIKGAHPTTLRGLLYFLTRDEDLVGIQPTKVVGFLTSNGSSIDRPEDLALLETKGVELLKAYRDGLKSPPEPSAMPKDDLLKALTLMVGMTVPPNEYEYWVEELGFDPWARELKWENKPVDKIADFKVIVIGAGMGGINAAIQLKRAGFPYKVFERNSGVGGTWFENSYPGARVDLPSRIYSHLFGINYPWQHMFATSKENEGYANWCVDNFGVRESIRFNTEVVSLHWNETSAEWVVRVRTRDGAEEEHRANGIIRAGGLFDRPYTPKFKGLDTFRGRIMHSTRYDTKLDMSQASVAIIGTGASGLQMIPDLAKQVKKLTVYQRTPGWVLPFEGYRDPLTPEIRWLDANMPFYPNFSRVATTWYNSDHDSWYVFTIDPDWKDEHTLNRDMYNIRERAIAHIKKTLQGRPDLIEKCIPDYPPMTKRFILDNGYYAALLRDNVGLVSDAIDHVEPDAIVTNKGERIPTDVIIFATGYQPNAFLEPTDIRGRNGITPQQVWKKDGARAFWGVTVPGLPNFFMIYGPGTNGKVSGPVPWGEMQTRYALKSFKALIENGLRSMDVRTEVYETFNEQLDKELAKTIWMDPRQVSYYRNEFGRSATNAPWKVAQLFAAWRDPKLEHYNVT